MLGKDRAHALNDRTPVRLKRVGSVVEFDPKQKADEKIKRPVQHKLYPRVINHAAALQKAAPKHAVVAFVQCVPIAHHITAIVRLVRHHDHHGVAAHLRKPKLNRTAESVEPAVHHRTHFGNFRGCLRENLPRSVRGPVVHHNDLVRDPAQRKLQMQVAKRRGNRPLLVPGGNHD